MGPKAKKSEEEKAQEKLEKEELKKLKDEEKAKKKAATDSKKPAGAKDKKPTKGGKEEQVIATKSTKVGDDDVEELKVQIDLSQSDKKVKKLNDGSNAPESEA